MNHEIWAWIDVNILLNAFFIWLKVILWEPSIKHPKCISKYKEHSEFNKRHNGTDHHSLDYGSTDISIPTWCKVRILPRYILVKYRNMCFCKISIGKHQDETSVKELSDKDSDLDWSHLSRLGVLSDHGNKFDHDELKDGVNDIDRHTNDHVHSLSSVDIDEPFSANNSVLSVSISIFLRHKFRFS